MLQRDENDQTYHPHAHAYSAHVKKIKGEDVETCWYCGKDKKAHKRQVVITKDGERKVVNV